MRLCAGTPKIDFSFLLNLYPVRETFATIDEIKEGFKALLNPAESDENCVDEDLQDLIRDVIKKRKGRI